MPFISKRHKMKIAHPSTFIDKRIADIIRDGAPEAERLTDLHPRQLKVIYQERWFKMFVAKKYGGLGWPLPRVLKLEEALSWADASTAWVVTLCGGAGWFTGFLHDTIAEEVAREEKMCFAGSGAPTGVANLTESGYNINGYWKYASGSLHATVFTANCMLYENGRPQYNIDDTPVIRAFLFLRDEVKLHGHWNSIGMIATGSYSFEVRDLTLPPERCFTIEAEYAILKDAVYRYPFLQLAETTLGVNMSGMAMRFLDLCDSIFSDKGGAAPSPAPRGTDRNEMLAVGKREMEKHRHEFYFAAEKSWDIVVTGGTIPSDVLQKVSDASFAIAHKSRQIVDALYPYCGMVAANSESEINRVWRNIHTASQHALFTSR